MTFATRLKTSTRGLGRLALGTALGLAMAAALLVQPSQAVAQVAAAQPVAPAAVPRAPGAGPALWVIKDADSTLYLFGTVHVLRPSTAWGSARVDAAFDSASEVYLEITNPDDQAAVVPLIQQYGLSLDRPLSSRLTAEELADLNAAAQSMNTTAAQFEPMKPWLVALTLSVAPLVKAGYDPQSGVELILRARANAAGKPVKGLETIDEQIRILAGLSDDTQVAFLRSTLDAFDHATVELDGLVAAWAAGDVVKIRELGIDDLRDESEEVYEALLVNRNTNWAGQIQGLLEGSGTTFIAVGAAHLAGDDSVQAILAKRGVEVERVE
ncbi:MAG: TraB/GumN family protein [Brevundimonas sp.]|nr:MAG: TraB/GumN family protein [Brevundimonas sp.]